jgi:hypothetical protein
MAIIHLYIGKYIPIDIPCKRGNKNTVFCQKTPCVKDFIWKGWFATPDVLVKKAWQKLF